MSVRFTPGLDDLVHPVRDAKLLAQFWPLFFFFVGAARKFTRSELAFVGVVVRAVRTSACLHAGLEEVAIPSLFFFFFFFRFSSLLFLFALERVDQLFEMFELWVNGTFFFREPQFLA